jgi:hypothetical protein
MFAKKCLLVILAVPTMLITTSPARADDKITDFGDGMVMTEYRDSSGFKVTGGGAEFVFNYRTKELVVIQGAQKNSFNWTDSNTDTNNI